MEISIVIPLYNPNYKFLFNLIHSIKQQIYNQYEVVFSDDDDCKDILYKCLNENDFNNFIYIKNTNKKKGIFSNLNNAINAAKYDLIQILCQDDYVKPYFLSSQYELINKYKDIGLIFSQFDLIDDKNCLIQEKYLDHHNRLGDFIEKSKLPSLFFFYGCFIGNISPVMLTRNVIKKIGLFNENFLFASDFEYWIRFCDEYNIIFNKTNNLCVRNHAERASITLPSLTLLTERKIIYKTLFNKLKDSSFFLKYVFINYEIGSWNVYYTLRKREFNKTTFNELNSFPFSFLLSTFFLIITLNGRIKIKFKL